MLITSRDIIVINTSEGALAKLEYSTDKTRMKKKNLKVCDLNLVRISLILYFITNKAKNKGIRNDEGVTGMTLTLYKKISV
jgi:hypothetical protein